ncbi:hypothetical protein MKW98_027912 [Papaver atlanticum]|uniref:Uncharacterized protein n=1 Tax=Papaver atlanticum TaxID=357466 RepID=A0AAD4XBQ7_9MAGN|nr:hypothetical protein MKW98_027912 [Papaver atlanticum]
MVFSILTNQIGIVIFSFLIGNLQGYITRMDQRRRRPLAGWQLAKGKHMFKDQEDSHLFLHNRFADAFLDLVLTPVNMGDDLGDRYCLSGDAKNFRLSAGHVRFANSKSNQALCFHVDVNPIFTSESFWQLPATILM